MKPASLVLQEARARIEDPSRWCTGTFNRGRKMCAAGAMGMTWFSELPREWGFLEHAAFAVTDGKTHVVSVVNDTLGHAAVMEMYDIAISAALSDEAAK